MASSSPSVELAEVGDSHGSYKHNVEQAEERQALASPKPSSVRSSNGSVGVASVGKGQASLRRQPSGRRLNVVERKRALRRVMAAMFFHVMAWAVTLPVLGPLIVDRFSDGDASKAATIQTALQFVSSVIDFVCNLVIGSLTDKYGRHKFFTSLLGLTSGGFFMFAFMPTLGLLGIAAVFRGFTSVGTVVGYAMIVDVTKSPSEDHTSVSKNMGIFLAVAALGLLLGTIVGGIVGLFSSELGFLCAGALEAAAALFVWFLVPETLDKPKAFTWCELMPWHVVKVLCGSGRLVLLAITFTIMNLSFGAYLTGNIYADYRFGWGAAEIALFLGFVGIVAMVTQGLIVNLLIPRLGEHNCLLLGSVVGVFHMAVLGLAWEGWMWYAGLIVTSLAFVVFPALRGLMAKEMPRNQQGQLQGAIGAMNTMSGLISPSLATAVFVWSETHVAPEAEVQGKFSIGAGAMWLFAAALFALAVPFIVYLRATKPAVSVLEASDVSSAAGGEEEEEVVPATTAAAAVVEPHAETNALA